MAINENTCKFVEKPCIGWSPLGECLLEQASQEFVLELGKSTVRSPQGIETEPVNDYMLSLRDDVSTLTLYTQMVGHSEHEGCVGTKASEFARRFEEAITEEIEQTQTDAH